MWTVNVGTGVSKFLGASSEAKLFFDFQQNRARLPMRRSKDGKNNKTLIM